MIGFPYTFFPDILSIDAIDPERLAPVNMPFGSFPIASRFKTDAKMPLYIKRPVQYAKSLSGLKNLSFQNADYIQKPPQRFRLMD